MPLGSELGGRPLGLSVSLAELWLVPRHPLSQGHAPQATTSGRQTPHLVVDMNHLQGRASASPECPMPVLPGSHATCATGQIPRLTLSSLWGKSHGGPGLACPCLWGVSVCREHWAPLSLILATDESSALGLVVCQGGPGRVPREGRGGSEGTAGRGDRTAHCHIIVPEFR